MDRWRRTLPLVAWLGALAVGLAVFHGLGQGAMAPPPLTDPGAWGAWMEAREPTVAVVAVLRLVVLALAWYLVGATTVGIVARLVRSAGLVRVADALTLPLVRRLLQGALGVTLATSMVGAATAPVVRVDDTPPRLTVAAEVQASDEAAPRLVQVSGDGDTTEEVRSSGPLSMRLVEQEDPAEGEGVPPPEVAEPADTAEAPFDDADSTGEAEPAGASNHTVVAGDSLWSIAQDTLARAWEREPTDAQVLAYWQQVIEHNRDGLADPDNPDLIFPGDEVRLPPVPDPAAPAARG